MFTVFYAAKAAKIAFEKAATVEIATRDFKVAGIYPFDRNVFTDADFFSSQVTDQDLQDEDEGGDQNGHRQIQFPKAEELSVAPEEISSLRNFLSNSPDIAMVDDVQCTASCLSSAIQRSNSTSTLARETQPTQTTVTNPENIIPLLKINIKSNV
ncbi:hypothetical protein ILUMI_25437 [Ignelater luminosus]|uniref:Uncharacterized protein n=1 Tax=Ignelater luminosus TaxID=2038154 RepID=A0A8K0FXX2_IGNLU|nr:hypothetical protein ILUMI_25437 [Ignelater luminosus]